MIRCATPRVGFVFGVLALAISGCGLIGGGGQSGDPGNSGNPGTSGAAGHGGSGTVRQPAPSAPPTPTQVLVSRKTSTGEVPILVEINSLVRQGELATLNFSVTSLAEEGEDEWQVADTFDGDSGLDVSGVTLVDGQNRKKYLVAQDSRGDCVCSSDLSSTFVAPGQTVLLTATFAAPPESVTTIDVSIPTAGTFSDVPIS